MVNIKEDQVFHHMVQMDPRYQKHQRGTLGYPSNYEASTVQNLFRKSKAQCPAMCLWSAHAFTKVQVLYIVDSH